LLKYQFGAKIVIEQNFICLVGSMMKYTFKWENPGKPPSQSFTCGYCSRSVASNEGWTAHSPSGHIARIYICHQCSHPTAIIDGHGQVPGSQFGNPVSDISDSSVESLYDEVRRCTAASCYTATILGARKLLMHIAVSQGAKPGLNFTDYVDHLSNNGFVPPNGKTWVDHIRKKGNEANHEINIGTKVDAEELLTFIEMLLKFIYEFPSKMNKKVVGAP